MRLDPAPDPGPDRPVRVLHLIAGLGGGGSERWLRDVVTLSPRGMDHRVMTVAPDGGPDPVFAQDLEQVGAYVPVRLPAPLPAGLRQLHRRWPQRSAGLRALARGAAAGAALVRVMAEVRRFRPDVIHAHTVPDFPVGVAAARAFHIPLVHTVPCLFSQLVDTGHTRTTWLYGALQSSVACFSTGEGWRELEQLGVPTEKIHYDLGGVDLERVDASLAHRQRHVADVRRELHLPPTCPMALSVGRLHPSKGHMKVLNSLPMLLDRVPDLHWVVLGEGEERHALEDRAAQLGMRHRAHFVGYQRDPLRFSAASDLYLRSTVFEPENLSFYEAMAMGLPAVGFRTGEWRDLIVVTGNGTQVPRGDVNQLAVASARLLQLPDRGRSLGARGAEYARQNLDLRSSVERLAAVYLRLSRNGSLRPS